jgi:hypothetical protein
LADDTIRYDTIRHGKEAINHHDDRYDDVDLAKEGRGSAPCCRSGLLATFSPARGVLEITTTDNNVHFLHCAAFECPVDMAESP